MKMKMCLEVSITDDEVFVKIRDLSLFFSEENAKYIFRFFLQNHARLSGLMINENEKVSRSVDHRRLSFRENQRQESLFF